MLQWGAATKTAKTALESCHDVKSITLKSVTWTYSDTFLNLATVSVLLLNWSKESDFLSLWTPIPFAKIFSMDTGYSMESIPCIHANGRKVIRETQSHCLPQSSTSFLVE